MIYAVLLISVTIPLLAVVAAGWWLKTKFPGLAHKALGEMSEGFLGLAKSKLELERQGVEHAAHGLEKQLKRYEELVRNFESDRDQKYGQLKNELERTIKSNDRLQGTTASLAAVLGNSRVRGQWGQKMADDILRFCGLQEGIQYHKERELASGGGRPDYTFLLPDQHCLFMDVKFPLENYMKFIEARQEDQVGFQEAFLRDVRNHLREMERRNYVTQSERSVDYLLVFISNEQVYGFINESEPGLIDECLRKRIILCGPWTLYAVVRIIWEAWQHYRYAEGIQDIVKAIDAFRQDYEKFKGRFEDLGKLIDKAQEKYQEITVTSYQRLDQKIQRIEDRRKGEEASTVVLSEPMTVTLDPVVSAKEDAE